MPAPSPSDLPASADTAIIVARPRLALWGAQLDERCAIMARQSRPRVAPNCSSSRSIDGSGITPATASPPRRSFQRRGQLRVIELSTRRSMDEFLETI